MSESTSTVPASSSWADLDDEEEDGKMSFKGLNPSANSFNPSSSSSSSSNTQQQQQQQTSARRTISPYHFKSQPLPLLPLSC
ncbi:hypothetical protein I302_108423 [Kwoniella bestiolae CBS 10118]|uniref:Uncharacterized protein n=1 Tax=Kwoniella bestiolae CBS 10118 TaxID=1296100 RepID=A0AAJ8KFH1_9TREE